MTDYYFFYVMGFVLIAFMQAFIINGVHYCFQGTCSKDIKGNKVYSGSIFYMLAPQFFEKNKHETWFKPVGGCVKCMASIWSAVTFLPLVFTLFGLSLFIMYMWVMDALLLVSLNWFIYKNL